MAYFFKRKGLVYFAKHQRADAVKIGFCFRNNPEYRVSCLRLHGSPRGRYRLLGVVAGKGRLEKEIHERFAEHRLPPRYGVETFRYSPIWREIDAIIHGGTA